MAPSSQKGRLGTLGTLGTRVTLGTRGTGLPGPRSQWSQGSQGSQVPAAPFPAPAPAPLPIVLPHGGYRKLIVYRKSETIYQGTVAFCRRFLPARGDRTVDQMVQAARSCKQNIAEGSAASGTSKETEIKLTNVARATLDELREDYLDRLRARGAEPWAADDERSVAARAFAKAHPDWDDWKELFESRPEETLCNLMLTLCHQARTLLDGMIRRQEEDFLTFGGVRERMHAARTEARGGAWDKTLYSRLDAAPDAAELRRRAEEIRRETTRAEHAIARRKGWE